MIRSFFVVVVGAVLTASLAFADEQSGGETFPFFPQQPEEFFERLFGKSTPAEEQALASIRISVQEEREFGTPQVEAFLSMLKRQQTPALSSGREVKYLGELVDAIRPLMANSKRYRKITVYLIDTDRVDARSFPGGTLFFTRGLLKFAKSEAALAGIVGHELSHLDHGHQLVPLKQSQLFRKQLAEGVQEFDPQRFMERGTMMVRLLGRPFRPEDESAADLDGARWAFESGYDPRALADLFERMHDQVKDEKVPFGDFFRTHPYNQDRSKAILQEYDALREKHPRADLQLGKENLARRITMRRKPIADPAD